MGSTEGVDLNLKKDLISPWNGELVNKAIAAEKKTPKEYAYDMVEWILSSKKYAAAGYIISDEEKNELLTRVKNGDYLDTFSPYSKAITVSDADALFIPHQEFITNDLTESGNTASDQKSSSSVIPRNTPVTVLGKIAPIEVSLSEKDNAWLLVWRPEFGFKFVLAEHIAWADDAVVEPYEQAIKQDQGLRLACTDRTHTYRMEYPEDIPSKLLRGTPIICTENYYNLVFPSATEEQFNLGPAFKLSLRNCQFTTANVVPIEKIPDWELDDHAPVSPTPFTNKRFVRQLENVTFQFPNYGSNNKNRSYGWGEATTGIDRLRGQDISSTVRYLLQPFGFSLPRFSKDQIAMGQKINNVTTIEGDPTLLFNGMLNNCKLGTFASFGPGNMMACLGTITFKQLNQLDRSAATYAKTHGGMTEDDALPMVVSSPVGFRDSNRKTQIEEKKKALFESFKQTLELGELDQTKTALLMKFASSQAEDDTPSWHISARTSVYFLTKEGPLSLWTRRNQMMFFKYYKDNPVQ